MSAEPLAVNPFWVLELPDSATPVEIERQKQKLLGMLELKVARAATFTVAGVAHPRTTEQVRQAADELRDPNRRIGWELRAHRAETELGAANTLLDSLCARASAGTAITAEDLEHVGATWDDVLADAETGDLIATRADALELDDTDEINQSLADGVERDLVACIARAPAFDLDDVESNLGTQARQRFIDQSVEPLELACERLESSEDLPRAWPGFAKHYEQVTANRGTYAERCAYDAVTTRLSHLAVDRFDGGAYEVGGVMFRWLRDRARDVGDDEAYETNRKNADIAHERVREHDAVVIPEDPMPWWRIGMVLGFIALLAVRFCTGATTSTTHDFKTRQIQIDPQRMEHIKRDLLEHRQR